MKIGETNLEVGTKVKIKGIVCDESFLNGYTGKLTYPHYCTGKEWVGVILDANNRHLPKCDVRVSEIEIIEDTHNLITIDKNSLYLIYMAGYKHGYNEDSIGTFEAFQRMLKGESPLKDGVSYNLNITEL